MPRVKTVAESQRYRRWQYRVFAVSWLTYAGYYLGRVNLAVAVPSLQAEFGWSRSMLGLLGSAFYWVYALGQLVNGHLGDRVSARRMVALGLVVSAAINLAMGGLGSFGAMVAIWAANGIAQSTGWGPVMKTLSRWFSHRQRGRLTAFFAPCYVLGHAISWVLAGYVVAAWGWRQSFRIPSLLLLLVAVVWYLLIRDEPADVGLDPVETDAQGNQATAVIAEQPIDSGAVRAGGAHGMVSAVLSVVMAPRLRWAMLVCFLSGTIKEGLTLWGPTYLMEQQGMAIAQAALVGTVIPISGAVGALLAGRLLHRLPGHREETVVAIMAGLIATTAASLFLVGRTGGQVLPIGLLALVACGGHGMNAMLMSSLPLSLGPRGKVSSAAGTLDFASYVGGGIGAVMVGGLQDLVGWAAVYGWWVLAAICIVVIAWRQRMAAR